MGDVIGIMGLALLERLADIPFNRNSGIARFQSISGQCAHVKSVSGRKSDVLDCQWLQQRMAYGLLRGTFRPTGAVCVLRSLWRQRGMLLRS